MPRPAQKLWGMSWKSMEMVRQKLIMTVTTFHTTSFRPIPWYSLPPLVISTTVCQMYYYSNRPSWKSICISTTTLFQCYRASGPIVDVSITVSISISVYASFTVSMSTSVIVTYPVTNDIATYAFCA